MMFEDENTPLDMLVDTYIEQQEIKMVINELIGRLNQSDKMMGNLHRQVNSLNKLLGHQTQMLTRLQITLANMEGKII